MPQLLSRRLRVFAALAASLALLALPAHAQSQASPEMRAKAYKVIRTCKADIQQFCKGIEYGGGRVAQCLQANAASVKPECRAALDEAMTP